MTMALLLPVNVSVDVYRTANPGAPYTLGALSASGVRGHLKPAVQNGRFGSATWLKWTHVLYLPPGTDVRDAYNTQLDPARDNTKGDTVILKDATVLTTKTAFYVVFVEQVARGTPAAYLRVYLDRFAPNAWPTNAL
jgi:hypothetical protein